jgi:WD40 repeat protein
MNLPAEFSGTLGNSTAEKPADTIFSGLSQVIQSVSVLKGHISELEQLRCLSLIHVAQFKADHELITASYRRLRVLLQQDQASSRSLAAPNPPARTDLKFRFAAAPDVPANPLKLCFSLTTGSVLCSVQFSPDGEVIACADSRALYLFSETGGLLTQAELPGDPAGCAAADPPRRLRFSPGGKIVAIPIPKSTIALFSVETSQFLPVLNGHQASVTSLLFSEDARVLYSGGADGTLSLWDVSALRLMRQNPHGAYSPGDPPDATQMIIALDFLADGQVLLVAFMAKRLVFYQADDPAGPSQQLALEHGGLVLDCRSLPDQLHFATVSQDTTARIWAYGQDIACVAVLTGHTNIAVSVCFSPDQMLAFTGAKDATMVLWGIGRDPRRLLTVSGYANTVFEIAHHPRKRCIVSCSGDGAICVWDYHGVIE